MAWNETTSLTFSARHDDADAAYSEGILDGLESLSLKLEDRFETVPGGITVVVHPNGAWLDFAHPFLPLVRWSSAPAGRRYLVGWAMTGEIHVLGEAALEKRAAGDASFEALKGSAERLYAQLVIAANNGRMPPPWSPSNFRRYLEWAWLVEGSAQHFARQVDLFRPAVIRRLREGARPTFPPARRDATNSAEPSSICSRNTAAVVPASSSSHDSGRAVRAPTSRPRSTSAFGRSRTSGATT